MKIKYPVTHETKHLKQDLDKNKGSVSASTFLSLQSNTRKEGVPSEGD